MQLRIKNKKCCYTALIIFLIVLSIKIYNKRYLFDKKYYKAIYTATNYNRFLYTNIFYHLNPKIRDKAKAILFTPELYSPQVHKEVGRKQGLILWESPLFPSRIDRNFEWKLKFIFCKKNIYSNRFGLLITSNKIDIKQNNPLITEFLYDSLGLINLKPIHLYSNSGNFAKWISTKYEQLPYTYDSLKLLLTDTNVLAWFDGLNYYPKKYFLKLSKEINTETFEFKKFKDGIVIYPRNIVENYHIIDSIIQYYIHEYNIKYLASNNVNITRYKYLNLHHIWLYKNNLNKIKRLLEKGSIIIFIYKAEYYKIQKHTYSNLKTFAAYHIDTLPNFYLIHK